MRWTRPLPTSKTKPTTRSRATLLENLRKDLDNRNLEPPRCELVAGRSLKPTISLVTSTKTYFRGQ